MFWEHEGNRAVREGRWKLVARQGQPWELYDIAVNRVESNNLAMREPDRVAHLTTTWNAWAARCFVNG